MAAILDPILRIVLLVFSIVALGLTAAWVHDDHSSSRVRFAVFSASFSIIIDVLYGLVAAFWEAISFPLALAVIDFMNWVFLFSGATAIAAKIGAGSCSNKSNLRKHFSHPTQSEKDCRMAQAGTAFLYFSWFVALVLFIYSTFAVFRGGSVGIPRRKSVPRTGVPTMSQV